MSDVLIVVIRYFGGVKLGAGGLVRAYAAAAESVLSEVERVEHTPQTTLSLEVPFALEQRVRLWAKQHAAQVGEVSYGQLVRMDVLCETADREDLLALCAAEQITVVKQEQ